MAGFFPRPGACFLILGFVFVSDVLRDAKGPGYRPAQPVA